MAQLTFQEQRTVEDFLEMGNGYVVNFSDRTFRDFIGACTDRDTEKYKAGGTSKANRLRIFIKVEDDYTVGKLFTELHKYKLYEERGPFTWDLSKDSKTFNYADEHWKVVILNDSVFRFSRTVNGEAAYTEFKR